MSEFYDSQGQAYVFTERIGSGGEGTVFVCPDDSRVVAKIYHEPVSGEKAEKLRWMAENKNDRLLKVAAWILDTLHDGPGGRIVGFLMPSVKAKEIHELYSLKSRRVYFPEATWKFLVHAAANLARAFYNLHKSGHIMGDVNHGNCVVLADGTVKLIDCDSYSISTGAHRYACEVGVATHLAPELQGKNLRAAERLFKHDNFGLAVIIFQLLFLGRHPFAGNYTGGEDKSLEECIRELRFAYARDAHLWQVKQPPGTLSLSRVSPRLAAMFERAFLTEDRPEPHEWIEALEDLSQSLKQCGLHPGHFYFHELPACPWCDIETRTGLMLFPFVSGQGTVGEETFNIFTVENLIASFGVPQNLPVELPKPAVLPPPLPEVINVKTAIYGRLAVTVIAQFFVLMFLVMICGIVLAFFISISITIAAVISFKNFDKSRKGELEDNLYFAQQDWIKLEEEWTETKALTQFNGDLAKVKQKVADYQNLHLQSCSQRKLLREQVLKYQLDIYLLSKKLEDAEIPGVNQEQLAELKKFGIRTAANVNLKQMAALPAVDYLVLKSKLLDWRKSLESNFEFNPDTELPEAEQKRFEKAYLEKRKEIVTEVESLLGGLRSGSVSVRQKYQQLFAKSEELSKILLQAESNFKAAATSAPATIILILVTILTLIFGNAAFRPPKPAPMVSKAKSSSYPYNDPPEVTVQSGGIKNPIIDEEIPENLTDKQIKAMSDTERRKTAFDLYKYAVSLGLTYNDFYESEQKLRLALKLVDDDPKIFYELGNALFEQEKYAEAVKFLKKSRELDPQNEGTKIYLGITFLKMKKFGEAVRILYAVTLNNPQTFEGHFNLGLAYKGLKDYNQAVSSFHAAVQINPEDAEAHYEYGFCLFKAGKKDKASEEYYILFDLDLGLSQKLGNEIGFERIDPPKIVVEGNFTN